ncbi:neutral zinc metallopeptidase [Acuticoccus sp.]|uniref:KPN_02809 family neutral zinc metallopeptidase n=1 Tax=Acuticoccus sp. TaxID=1904378 RepID=UPI003B52AC6D
MRWEGRRQSDNVVDRRGRGPISGRRGLPRGGRVRIPRGGSSGGLRRAGGGSIVLVILVALGLWIFAGINPIQLLDMLARQDGAVVTQAPRSPEQVAADDERSQFLSVVLAETEDTWGRIFRDSGSTYEPPRLVLYSGAVNSDCGFGTAAAGPFYCPADRQVYVDLSFFDLLAQRLNAPGDFAQAYVVAHEVGHHVQNLTGVLGRYQQARQGLSEREANAVSVRVELQADCYAGVWAHSADRIGLLEEGDIDEALGAASAVGDDVMQRRTQGTVVPESFNHGTAAERARWFTVGYRSGDPGACDTFEAR